MTRAPTDLPERLVAGDATDFERRMIEAASERGPSTAASARMAKALGVMVTSVGTAAASKALAADAASKATAAAGASTVWPWVSVGVLGLVVAGAVVGTGPRHAARREPPSAAPQAAAPARSPALSEPARREDLAEPTPVALAPPVHHLRLTPASSDLRDEIALLDTAREALSEGSPQRALELLRRYQDRYPSGSFRPEATATRIEALVKLGREDEARALATRLIAQHRGSLLATRVAELVGLSEPTTAP